ncbi:MAG: MoaD family protein [Candidatus Thorarchaeota archaeon]|jgi:molybdopterin synthase sulfur carrier subunit
MAKVTVKFFATVREVTKIPRIEMEAKDIRELLDALKVKYGKKFIDTVIDSETGDLKRFFSCMINGKRIELLDGYESILEDGDAVALFPPVGGG